MCYNTQNLLKEGIVAQHPLFGKKQTAEHIKSRVLSRMARNPNYMPPGYIVWNKGKTKETDTRIAKQADTVRLGRKFHNAGYVLVYQPEHPCADRVGYVLEHRIVAEEKLGRPLYDYEVIHHLDHDRTNNAKENLVIITQSEHIRKYHGKGTRKPRKNYHQIIPPII
jgi:hypothetical protein